MFQGFLLRARTKVDKIHYDHIIYSKFYSSLSIANQQEIYVQFSFRSSSILVSIKEIIYHCLSSTVSKASSAFIPAPVIFISFDRLSSLIKSSLVFKYGWVISSYLQGSMFYLLSDVRLELCGGYRLSYFMVFGFAYTRT